MIDFRKIFEPKNRVVLLDVVIFFVNLILLTVLARIFAGASRAALTDVPAKAAMLVFCLGLCLLSPAGALLKRRSAHRRNPELGTDYIGCFWLPYFLSQLLFWIAVGMMSAEMLELIKGDENAATGLFLPLFFGVPLAAILNTLILYFYFMKPRHAPVFNFFESPLAESLGDLCLFLNLIGYQVFWIYLMSELPKDYAGLFDRLFMFLFTAALIYLPPRLFYLVENYEEPRVWWAMLLSNSPIILRLLLLR
ncbi:MAG TPA: hypothetical protein VFA21_15960 [Pyrinomonadaceae bacterium]|nr:hypothetical protein [Pyrinomonadaceae bacterium]